MVEINNYDVSKTPISTYLPRKSTLFLIASTKIVNICRHWRQNQNFMNSLNVEDEEIFFNCNKLITIKYV